MEKVSLTLPQYNIYTQEITNPGTDINVLYFVAEVEADLDKELLNQAINLFLKGNDAVRLQVCMENGVPVQFFKEYKEYFAKVVDLRNKDDEYIEQYVKDLGQVPFEFENSRLFEFEIFIYNNSFGLFGKFHHIWADGWGVPLTFKRILDNYFSLLKGNELKSEFPSYMEFIKSDKLYRESNNYKNDKEFWEKAFNSVNKMAYVKQNSFGKNNSRRIFFSPEKNIVQGIKTFSAKYGVQPYIVFTAALGIYMWYISDVGNVVLGVPRLNRDSDREREIIGMFVADMPLCFNVEEDFTFLQLCKSIAINAKESAKHKKYPLSEIIKIMHKNSDVNKNIYYAVSYHKRPSIVLEDTEVKVNVKAGTQACGINHITMHIWDLGDEYTVFYDYSCELFDEIDIRRIHSALINIISEGIIYEDCKCKDINVLSKEEKDKLNEFNQNSTDYDDSLTINRMFADMVELSPDTTALKCNNIKYTYNELASATDVLAVALTKKGVVKEDAIAVILPRSEKLIISMFGIIKAGGAFVLIDGKLPENRINYILKDSNVKYVITSKKMTKDHELIKEHLYIEELLSFDISDEVLTNSVDSDSVCFISYTSGSTGDPKGAANTHRGLVNLCHKGHTIFVDEICFEGGTILSMGSVSFDLFVFECLPSLLNGVTVVITSEDELNQPSLLAKRIVDDKINILYTTPSRMIMNCKNHEFTEALKYIKVIVCAGEKLERSLVIKLNNITKAKIINGYGPTEVSIATAFKEVNEDDINLGKSIANYKTFVVGERMQQLPIGAVGELYIGGVGLSKGYVNRQDLTKEKFVMYNGQRVYRSGDLVSYNNMGELNYVGRIDNQVKVRGFRIELSEIEQRINQYEGISQSVVFVKEIEFNKYICAYYTEEFHVDLKDLKVYLAKYLPYYMLPDTLVMLSEMPVTNNGKIDMKVLVDMDININNSYEPPVTNDEKALLNIFSTLLEKDSIGIDHDFFHMGGDSLLAARVVVEAAAVGINISYQDVFNFHTVRQLCLNAGKQKLYSYDEEIEKYDYNGIEQLLNKNVESAKKSEKKSDSIMLTGSTGYLGAHVLYELIKTTDCKIYCLVRQKGKFTPEQRVKNILFYYFEENFSELLGERIFAISGDITKENIFDEDFSKQIDVVINAAADVSHFTSNDSMKRTNVDGIRNLINLCKKLESELIHISTLSVGQIGIIGQTENDAICHEKYFYFKQDLSNQYLKTKFLAERYLLEAIQEGLCARIIRVGNLQGRFLDGEFQINNTSNRFTNSLQAYVFMGIVSESIKNESVDISPVDFVAKGIAMILQSDYENIIYHLYHDKGTYFGNVLKALKDVGYNVKILSDAEYSKEIKDLLNNEEKRKKLYRHLSEQKEVNEELFYVPMSNDYTMEIMRKYGFEWPQITKEYLHKYLTALQTLGFFDEEDE